MMVSLHRESTEDERERERRVRSQSHGGVMIEQCAHKELNKEPNQTRCNKAFACLKPPSPQVVSCTYHLQLTKPVTQGLSFDFQSFQSGHVVLRQPPVPPLVADGATDHLLKLLTTQHPGCAQPTSASGQLVASCKSSTYRDHGQLV